MQRYLLRNNILENNINRFETKNNVKKNADNEPIPAQIAAYIFAFARTDSDDESSANSAEWFTSTYVNMPSYKHNEKMKCIPAIACDELFLSGIHHTYKNDKTHNQPP